MKRYHCVFSGIMSYEQTQSNAYFCLLLANRRLIQWHSHFPETCKDARWALETLCTISYMWKSTIKFDQYVNHPIMKTYSFSQIKLFLFEHDTSFQWNELPVKIAQSSMFKLFGSLSHQLVYWAIVWVDIHTYSPTTNMSVNLIHKFPVNLFQVNRVRVGFSCWKAEIHYVPVRFSTKIKNN